MTGFRHYISPAEFINTQIYSAKIEIDGVVAVGPTAAP
jgi:hypothetical protein